MTFIVKALTEHVRQVVLRTLYVFDGVIIDLQIRLDIKESGVLDLGYVLELEVFESTAVRQYFDRAVDMSRIEMAFLEAVLYRQ